MDNSFGISTELIIKALKCGIKIKKDNQFINSYGFLSLRFIPQINKFVFTYGTNASDAGYVLVEDYNNTWVLE